jgi:hypothetical protein
VRGQCAWACVDGWQRFLGAAATRTVDGDAGATPLALLRLWGDQLDAASHAAMQSDAGLRATAATVRAASHRRLAGQRLLDLGCEGAGLPTRHEIDEAFREIQALKRELRRLRRSDAALAELATHG